MLLTLLHLDFVCSHILRFADNLMLLSLQMARTRAGRGRGGGAAQGAQVDAPEVEAAPAWFTAFMNPLMARVEQLEAAQAASVAQSVGVEPVIQAPPPP